MRIIGKILLGLLAILGLLSIVIVGGLWLAVRDMDLTQMADGAPLPDRFVLQLPLEAPFPERDPALPFLDFQQREMALRQVIATIDAAADDPRVAGLIGTVAESGRSMAQAQELRAAIARFRAAGKPTLAFADTLGEAGAATVDTYLATAFDRVMLQPSGMIALTGFASEVPFARSALEEIGIDAEFGQRWEYKNAMDSLVRDDMSAAHRASMTALFGDLQEQAVTGIAEARALPIATVRERVNGLPLLAAEALDAGLIDQMGYWQDAVDALAASAGTTDLVPLPRYAGKRTRGADLDSNGTDAKIALIEAVGTIHRGDTEASPFGGGSDIGGDTVARAIREALEDEDVRAIVLRIDSPGGSYVASDTVWHEVRRARERQIPIIASLGGVAASGGYFIAMGADHIIARPGSITGSIGVFAGKPVLAEMWEKLGVSWERINVGDHALMWSPNRAFTEAERQWFDSMLDTIYADFTGKAATARNLTPEAIDAAARGRVFTGEQALEARLVDALGGLPEALAEARSRAGAPDAHLTPFPEPKGRFEAISDMLSGGDFVRALAVLGQVGALAEPLATQAGKARVATQGPAVLAPY